MEREYFIDINFCQKNEDFGYVACLGSNCIAGGYLGKTVDEGVIKLNGSIDEASKSLNSSGMPEIKEVKMRTTSRASSKSLDSMTLKMFRDKLSEKIPHIDFILSEKVYN